MTKRTAPKTEETPAEDYPDISGYVPIDARHLSPTYWEGILTDEVVDLTGFHVTVPEAAAELAELAAQTPRGYEHDVVARWLADHAKASHRALDEEKVAEVVEAVADAAPAEDDAIAGDPEAVTEAKSAPSAEA